MDNMKIWTALKRPPETALKKITGGRLSGMTDIKPQWRYEAMTELFGPVGVGWKYEIKDLWIESGAGDIRVANALISLYYMHEDKWSEAVPGVGGSMLVAKESAGPHTSDECYKMAITDALSVAMKFIGVAADIYSGLWDGSKYLEPVFRFKPGEKDNIIKQVLRCLDAGDEHGLQEILSEYKQPEEKIKVWALFNSGQRKVIKELTKEFIVKDK